MAQKSKNQKNDTVSSDIAIVGLGCHYPGARNPKELWENVLSRRREFRQFLDQRLPMSDYFDPDPTVPDKVYISNAAYIDGFDFDWLGRRIPKKTFDGTDIVQWLALEVAEKAIVDAGYTRESVPRERTGVILGNSLTGEQSRANNMRLRWPYVKKVMLKTAKAMGINAEVREQFVSSAEEVYKSVFPEVNEDSLQGGLSNTIAGRVANYFDLHGGGYVVDGACSSSLLAVCTAASQLANNDMDMCLAGGVDVSLDTFELIGFAKTSALAKTDMHVYDKRGAGFLPGEGCGFVVLKRLEDAEADGDEIYSVLRGWGVSSDGKGGITAPSSDGQASALIRAYDKAGYSPHDLDFIEGHGTGTMRGDKTELEGIAKAIQAFGETEDRFCGMTSFKSIVGHTKAAAGIGAFIKTVLATNRRILPPTANCREPNAVFESTARNLYPITHGRMFSSEKIVRAGVSAMGFGGINSHVTLESYQKPLEKWAPLLDERALLVSNQDSEIFVLSASSLDSLASLLNQNAQLAEGLSIGDLSDFASQLSTSIDETNTIRAVVISSQPKELAELFRLQAKAIDDGQVKRGEVWESPLKNAWLGQEIDQTKVGFLLPGQGSQRLGVGRVLVERFDWARDLVEMADKVAMAEIGKKISLYIFRPLDQAKDKAELDEWRQLLSDTKIAQPAICLVSLLYIKFLEKLGVKPKSVAGHSLGELTAFYAAGVFDEESLIRLAIARGQAMERSSDIKGAMASVFATETIVKGLFAELDDGYVTIANINSPQQTVISGEEAAVQEVIEIAQKQGIEVRQLPVSDAFHSTLMENAAAELKQTMSVPKGITGLSSKLYSSTNGELVGSECDLYEHFPQQILSQVDFISLVNNLNKDVDFILEVGSGSVLTGLVSQISLNNTTQCFPVASRVNVHKDLHTALAQLFVSGTNIDWSCLYKQRLIRAFKPTAERVFIENPCEREMLNVEMSTNVGQRTDVGFNTGLLSLGNISGERIDKYLSQRGNFIADVIRSDMASMEGFKAEIDTIVSNVTDNVSHLDSVSNSTSNIQSQQTTQEILLKLVSETSGFPEETISLEARLLDDLNLDSIKAGQLIADYANELGISGQLDASSYANASLEDIIDAVNKILPETSTSELTETVDNAVASKQTFDVEALVMSLVADATGFPKESLAQDVRLLDDLNLDSIKSGTLLGTIFRDAGAEGEIEAAQYANASIAEIISAIKAAKKLGVVADQAVEVIEASEPASVDQGVELENTKNWVRNYILELVPEELANNHQNNLELNNKVVLVLSDQHSGQLIDSLSHVLAGHGAKTIVKDYDSIFMQQLVSDNNISHVIGILANSRKNSSEIESSLKYKVMRLQKTIATATAVKSKNISFVQFGGGSFATKLQEDNAAVCCAIGLARSYSLERPELSIRVIDLSTKIHEVRAVNNIANELGGENGFKAIAYNDDNLRLIQQAKTQQPALNILRSHHWTSEDVILITGGAKGITAECALALAEQTGAKIALVGSSPLPNMQTNPNHEISKNLLRFEKLGVVSRYFSCNLTLQAEVEKLVANVTSELGNITGVVYGAGMNIPRMVEQVSVEEAMKEISPKVLGAEYLLQALAKNPPKLIVGFSSIIGVTGMPGNAWYAFSNESLDLILRDFNNKHNTTDVVSIAYSVWDEVGMGHRLGAVDNLDKMGVGAISPEQGVKRFIQLFQSDPGEKQVIVAGPLGGLATWQGLTFQPKPEAHRFIDEVIKIEPGVELKIRTKLSKDKDIYLNDHNFRGTLLFPTVFGLEAMAQAVLFLTGCKRKSIVSIKQINLSRPIVVSDKRGEGIELVAVATECDENNNRSVKVGIRTEQSGYKVDHFSAVFELSDEIKELPKFLVNSHQPLDIDPKWDLYGEYLFQGALFQKMEEVYSITRQQVIMQCESREIIPKGDSGLSLEASVEFVLGDAFYRDVLLQSVQLPATPNIVLPISIGEINFYGEPSRRSGKKIVTATLKDKQEKDYIWDVVVADETGHISEKLIDYRVRTVNDPSRKGYPSIRDLMENKKKAKIKSDQKVLQTVLTAIAKEHSVTLPCFTLSYEPQLGRKPKQARHQIETAQIEQLLNEKGSILGVSVVEPVEIEWLESGKPVFDNNSLKHLDLSISHDNDYCLCSVGQDKQGCDLELVEARTLQDWSGLLGQTRMSLYEQLIQQGHDSDVSGTRLWSTVEAIIKATGNVETCLTIKTVSDAVVIFEAQVKQGILEILTTPLNLSVGHERMIALVILSQPILGVRAA